MKYQKQVLANDEVVSWIRSWHTSALVQHKSNGYAYGAVPGVSLVAEMDSIRLGWEGGMAWYLSLAVGGGQGGGEGRREGGENGNANFFHTPP